MAHQKIVIDFALFFYALFNSPIIMSRPEKGLQRLIIKDNHWGLKNIVLI